MYATTADFQREGSPCNREWDYASKVRDGIIDDPYYLPVIYEASIEDDWTSEETWYKANPNLGISIPLVNFKEEFQSAKEQPHRENTFKRLHLNIITGSAERWLSSESWKACAGEFTPEDLRGMDCYGGIDLAATTDIAAPHCRLPDDCQGILQHASNRLHELGTRRAVDDSMIAAHGEAHAFPRGHGTLVYHRLLHDTAHGQQSGLRRVDDAGKLVDLEHAEVGHGECTARVLVRLQPFLPRAARQFLDLR